MMTYVLTPGADDTVNLDVEGENDEAAKECLSLRAGTAWVRLINHDSNAELDVIAERHAVGGWTLGCTLVPDEWSVHMEGSSLIVACPPRTRWAELD